MSRNPFRRQLPVYSPLSLRAVMASFVPGDPTEDLERTLERLYCVKRAFLTDSGTSALALGLGVALDRRPGGYCLLPGFGCYDLATAALGAGARVMLYDIEPTTLAPRLDTLLPFITEECAAVVVVDHYGVPPSLDEVMPLAAAAGVPVIEDAAQAAGSAWDGARIGNRTQAAVLSFGRGKGVTAGGGGALLLGATLADSIQVKVGRTQTSHAFTMKLVAQYLLARPTLYALPARLPFLRLGETVYREPSAPARIAPAAARVLSQSLRLLESDSITRWANADRLRATQSRRAPAALVVTDRRASPGWLRLPHLVDASVDVDRSAAGVLGVVPSYPRPLSALEPLRPALMHAPSLPGAIELSRRLWTLPTHSKLSRRDLDEIEHWMERFGA